ncbi:MAG TPA: sulfurtransferase TusA family protein [Jiangellaceae bacterium]|jgi:TusA-related sulfurtransferase|nr:sulfurtransferase TusA family protein [Jiangellaceae bacterium]
MTDLPDPDLTLDCRSMRCPLPVIELARRITEAPASGIVAVVADDPAAATDIPAWCRLRGHEYLGIGEPVHGAPAYLVRKSR